MLAAHGMEAVRVIGGVIVFFGILYARWVFSRWSIDAIGNKAIGMARDRSVVSDRDVGDEREVTYRGGRAHWAITGMIAGLLSGVLSHAILGVRGPTLVVGGP